MADQAVLKEIKIKIGVVKRLVKEHASYIKEVEKEAVRVEKLKREASNEDEEYAAKKAETVLQETKGMVGDSARRCSIAAAELKKLIDGAGLDAESQEFKDAQEQLHLSRGICA